MSRYYRRRSKRQQRRYGREFRNPAEQRQLFHKQVRTYLTVHIVLFLMAIMTGMSFPWFLTIAWGGYLVYKYVKYFKFTDHPQSDDETRYLPSPREEDWLSRRREKEYREAENTRNWRDRDLV